MKWITLECNDQHLITSDNPVVRVTPPDAYHPMYGDGGFLNKRTFVTLPLTPTKLLELHWGNRLRPGVYRVDRERGRLYNRQRAAFSERYLYASRRDSGIMTLARKYARPGVRMDLGSFGKLAPIELKRKL
jgi:hypothetical protein